jgi:hypothetical protein
VIRQATINWISNAGENAINGDNDTQQNYGDDDDADNGNK